MDHRPVVVEIKEAVARLKDIRLSGPLDWTIREAEQWALVGANGSGKTLVANILQGRTALLEGHVRMKSGENVSEVIKGIAFRDIYSVTDCRESYYQQRWQSTEVEEMPCVADILKDSSLDEEEWCGLACRFGITDFLSKKLICLSSGELRKFIIVKTLMTHPRILVLDNPYIGLDARSRNTLTSFLRHLVEADQIQLVLLLSDPKDIPDFITHILPVKDRSSLPAVTRDNFFHNREHLLRLFEVTTDKNDDLAGRLPVSHIPVMEPHKVTFRMENVNVRYGERVILKDLNWEVLNGEKWSLSGPNGSGKSTLLSLVYADNPQSYANKIYLFDGKRGSGESIWDIKKRIGYVSPEMYTYYNENVSSLRIVASGLFDSIGLYRKCSAEQEDQALAWMRVFGIESLKDRLFLSLSNGEQRLVLLARSFVKNPSLLILDEPLHGLDVVKKAMVTAIINKFCSLPGKTLIYVTHYKEELPECIDHHFELSPNI